MDPDPSVGKIGVEPRARHAWRRRGIDLHLLKEIADILKISPKTVEFHKATIMDELGMRTTAELTRYAIANGYRDPLAETARAVICRWKAK
jgi:DNA-binding CsgD family transcriptional regulator